MNATPTFTALAMACPPQPVSPQVSEPCKKDWSVVAFTSSPFKDINLQSTVLYQAKKAFTCFQRILNMCCIDCQGLAHPTTTDCAEISSEVAIFIRLFV